MTTVSVPLKPETEQALRELVDITGASKAAVIRKAIEKWREEEAINAVLQSEREISEGTVLRGDINQMLG